MNNKILICDDINLASNFDGNVILWNGKSDKENIISVPTYLDENKEKIREDLLELSHECSIYNINNKSILEHLEIDSDFSYWWFTTLGQLEPFANGKSIYDLMKSLCLSDILKKNMNYQIYLNVKNKKNFFIINQVLHHYKIVNISKSFLFSSILEYFNKLPDILIFLVGLLKFTWLSIKKINFNFQKKSEVIKEKEIHMFDILAHYKVVSNIFKSGYWSDLKEYLDQKDLNVEWNHIYFKSSKNLKLSNMINLCSKYDKKINSNSHIIIDGNISLKDYLKIVKKVFILLIKYKIIIKKNSNNIFNIDKNENKWNYFNVIESEFQKSIIGLRSFINIYFFILMENKISKIKNKPICVFIQENQPWEYSLSYFWKKYVNNKIVGVPHTTIPYFDFRYFFHKKTFGLWGYQPCLPEVMAINGSDMQLKLNEFNFIPSKLFKVEALRYNYLNSFNVENKKINKIKKMLIIGDLVKDITLKHIEFIQKWYYEYKPNIDILFRPHPAAIVSDYKEYSFIKLSNESLLEDINNCDLFCVNNTTSAAADIYAMGLPLITYNDLDQINFSPISNNVAHRIVSDIESFNQCFETILNIEIIPKNYFDLNSNIPAWKSLINTLLLKP
tara:strand:+ start:27 stop:1877 length:1851 start_codon:yes stop_codon:yes gene_type:complete